MKSQMKTVVAIVGGFVVVGMGVLTVVVGGTEAHANVKIGGAGNTVTSTTAPMTLEIPSASPKVLAPRQTK
jgi:hypothetical protein